MTREQPIPEAQAAMYARRQDFEDDLKHAVDIKSLYTELTGENFHEVKSRLRARCSWRDDANPSLSFHDGHPHILTDFAETWGDSKPKTYDAIDLLMVTQTCISKLDAVGWLCDRLSKEFPADIYRGAKGLEAIGLGGTIKKVWDMCRQEARDFVDLAPSPLRHYLASEDIPLDPVFFDAANLGLCPPHDTTREALKTVGLDPPFGPNFGRNAVAFPLYNSFGALVGIKFRLANDKLFHPWDPTKQPSHFNLQRFRGRPKNAQLKLVEGEGNVIAFAVMAYNEAKRLGEDPAGIIDAALHTIYCIGSKTNGVRAMAGGLPYVVYYPDLDQIGVDGCSKPEDHIVFQNVTGVQGQLESLEFMVVDWMQVDGVFPKYDFKDFLKAHGYDPEALNALKQASVYRYGLGLIAQIAATVKDPDNREVARAQMSDGLRARMNIHQGDRLSALSEQGDGQPNVKERVLKAKWGSYFINESGHICQYEFDAQGDLVNIKDLTNFYVRMVDVVNELDVYSRTQSKTYRLQIMLDGKPFGPSGDMKPDEVTDQKKLESFVACVGNLHDCRHEPGFSWAAVKGLLSRIPPDSSTTMVNSLGRPPFEAALESELGTHKYCLMPNVSAINGEVRPNLGIHVSIKEQGGGDEVEGRRYLWSVIDDEQSRQAADLFWNDLLKVHSPIVMRSLVALHFDGCARELIGDEGPTVQNDHGFTIYLAGQSGSAKTTAARYSMALLGEFVSQQDLDSWENTINYIDNILMRSGTVTTVLDELKNEDKVAQDAVRRVFNAVYGGSTRGRLTSSAEARGEVKVRCHVVVTSEAEPETIPESIASRMLAFRVARGDDEEMARRKSHMDTLDEPLRIDGKLRTRKSLLHGLFPRMIAWEQRQEDAPYARAVRKWNAHFSDRVRNFDNAQRATHMVTRLVSAYERICDFMGEHGYVHPAEAQRSLEVFAEYWNVGIIEQALKVKSRSSTMNTAKYLGEILVSQSVEMGIYNGESSEKWSHTGYPQKGLVLLDVTYPDVGRKILIVNQSALLRKMSENSRSNILSDKFIQDGKETGLIEADRRQAPPGSRYFDSNTPYLSIDYRRLMAEFEATK